MKDILEGYVCRLYGIKDVSSMNEARYKLFSKGKKIPDPQRLPPTRDALYLHFDRTNYQTFQWKNAIDLSKLRFVNPVDKGWEVRNNKLEIHWWNNKPAPESIPEFVSCQCRKINVLLNQSCNCYAINLECTDNCSCNN